MRYVYLIISSVARGGEGRRTEGPPRKTNFLRATFWVKLHRILTLALALELASVWLKKSSLKMRNGEKDRQLFLKEVATKWVMSQKRNKVVSYFYCKLLKK